MYGLPEWASHVKWTRFFVYVLMCMCACLCMSVCGLHTQAIVNNPVHRHVSKLASSLLGRDKRSPCARHAIGFHTKCVATTQQKQLSQLDMSRLLIACSPRPNTH